MACSTSCRERKRAARIGLEAERALSATRHGGPIWPRPPSRSSFRVRATFAFNKHHAAVPADAVYIDRGSWAIRIDNDWTGSSRLKRVGSPTSFHALDELAGRDFR